MASISTPPSASATNTDDRTPTPRSVPAATQTSAAITLPELTENLPSIHGFTGRSPAIRQLILQMQRMASHLVLATLEGEEGTGSSLAAFALHAAGPASHANFVPCLATEFFAAPEGNLRRAWSAELLLRAQRGMLFLDQVHKLSPRQQESLANLLHWFDHSRLHPAKTAATAASPFSPAEDPPAQIVFSTRVPLRSCGFREDLASQLCSVRFRLPPLRERREDIPLLAQIFIQRAARSHGKTLRGLGPGSIAPLLRYAWPGNVRELEEVINAAAKAAAGQWIQPNDFPPLPAERQGSQRPATIGQPADINGGPLSGLGLDQAIFDHVTRVLDRTRGNKLRAAQLLGISRSTLYRILAGKDTTASDETS